MSRVFIKKISKIEGGDLSTNTGAAPTAGFTDEGAALFDISCGKPICGVSMPERRSKLYTKCSVSHINHPRRTLQACSWVLRGGYRRAWQGLWV